MEALQAVSQQRQRNAITLLLETATTRGDPQIKKLANLAELSSRCTGVWESCLVRAIGLLRGGDVLVV